MRYLFVAALLAVAGTTPSHAQGFGGAVAASDGWFFVGETANLAFPGRVFLYETVDDGTVQERGILERPAQGKWGDGFGSALAADALRLLVGAADALGGAGEAYLYERSETGDWGAPSVLLPQGDRPIRFGLAVALESDRAAVSARSDDGRQGLVFLFRRTAGIWTDDGVLAVDKAGPSFGTRIVFAGSELLIGAPDEDDRNGSVYIAERSDDGWNVTTQLPAMGGRAGYALASWGSTVLVGAPNALAGGAVGVFDREADGWRAAGGLLPFAAQPGGAFGSSIDVAAHSQAVVGFAGGRRGTGGVYSFERAPDGSWRGARRWDVGELPGRARFGSAIAVQGATALVGAPGWSDGAGAVVVFYREAGFWQRGDVLQTELRTLPSITDQPIRCESDEAAGFPCKGVDLLSFVSLPDLMGERGMIANDIWGWEDPVTGHEYALVGLANGTTFVDVSDPSNPVVVGELPMTDGANAAAWRDIKVYRDHAYIVADGAGPHGLQVFDLSRLRSVVESPVVFEPTAWYGQIASAHNIVINENTGFAYAVGNSAGGTTCGGGLHMVDVRDPKNPVFAGCFAHADTGRRGTGYAHDAQCVTYAGPDADYSGREICFGSNETALSISDVTDKDRPVAVAVATYPAVSYAHQGWLTEDQRYFYMNDEGDESSGQIGGTRTLIWDVIDLDDPVLVGEHIAETQSTDHNLYVRGNLMYQSNYYSGLRIYDVSDPANPVEVGYFDTVPYGTDRPGTGGGSWSNYPFFRSGIIVVTSQQEGLFVLRKQDVDL